MDLGVFNDVMMTATDTAKTAVNIPVAVGAGFGVLQMLAQFLTLVLPANTVAYRIAKAILGGANKE